MATQIDSLQKELDAINAALAEMPGSKVENYAPMRHDHPHTHPYAKEYHKHPEYSKVHDHPYSKKHDHPYSKEHDHPYAKEGHVHSDMSKSDHKHTDVAPKVHTHKELEKLVAKYVTLVSALEARIDSLEKMLESLLSKPDAEPMAPPEGWEFEVKDPKGGIIQKITADRKG